MDKNHEPGAIWLAWATMAARLAPSHGVTSTRVVIASAGVPISVMPSSAIALAIEASWESTGMRPLPEAASVINACMRSRSIVAS